MKFGKKYEAYMRGMEAELPAVGIKRLKKMLKTCRRSTSPSPSPSAAASSDRRCTGHCTGKTTATLSSFYLLFVNRGFHPSLSPNFNFDRLLSLSSKANAK
jgi:hypothetical protein